MARLLKASRYRAMTSTLRKILPFMLLVVAWAVQGTTLQEMSIEAVTRQAELVFEGQVLQIEALREADGRIATFVTFEVIEVVKGDWQSDSLELRFLGGTVEGRTVAVGGMRLPETGEHGIYFVESIERDLVNPLLGWSQGHYLIAPDEQGVARVTTANHLPIVDVQPLGDVPVHIRRPLALVDGEQAAAAGIVVEPDASPGLTVDQFKQRIHELIESDAQP